MSKSKVQMKSKAQTAKKNEEGWNNGTLEYWVKKTFLESLTSSHPLFHDLRIISYFGHFIIHLILELWNLEFLV